MGHPITDSTKTRRHGALPQVQERRTVRRDVETTPINPPTRSRGS